MHFRVLHHTNAGRLVKVERFIRQEMWCRALMSITPAGETFKGCFACGRKGRAAPVCVTHNFKGSPIQYQPVQQLWFMGASHAWRTVVGF